MGKPGGASEDDLVVVRSPLLSFWGLSESELPGDQRVKPLGSGAAAVAVFFPFIYLFYRTFIPQTHTGLEASITPHC